MQFVDLCICPSSENNSHRMKLETQHLSAVQKSVFFFPTDLSNQPGAWEQKINI